MIHFDDFMPTGYQVDTSVFANIGDMLIQRDGLIASLAGNNRIVSGVVNDGNDNYSEGFIVFNGKPYRFLPGQLKAKLKIKRIAHTRADENGEQKPSHYEDVLEFSTDAAAEIVFADLQRWYPNQPILKEIKEVAGNVTNATLPAGWFIADGTNGTDDLRSLFIVAKDTRDVDYDAVGKTGGEKRHQLTIAEMPKHKFGFDQNGAAGEGGTGSLVSGDINIGTPQPISNSFTEELGNDTPHENRPPYFVAVRIQFIGI